MSTAFDDLVDAFALQLGQAPAVCANIYTDDADPLPVGDASSVLVTLGSSEPETLGGVHGNPIDWLTQVQVHCVARTIATSARPGAHTLAALVYARLAADPSVGMADDAGVHIGEPAISREIDKASNRMAVCTLSYSVRHRTSSSTLE